VAETGIEIERHKLHAQRERERERERDWHDIIINLDPDDLCTWQIYGTRKELI
jgi:hypothetical protein